MLSSSQVNFVSKVEKSPGKCWALARDLAVEGFLGERADVAVYSGSEHTKNKCADGGVDSGREP